MAPPKFDKRLSLEYLGLPDDYTPSPDVDPISFLTQHIFQLPPHLLSHYSYITTPKQRTAIPTIRNRRLQYANENPPELGFDAGRKTWPDLWEGHERRGVEEGKEERAWAEQRFLEGTQKHVGKLGNLLAEYEEEREAERVRNIRRAKAVKRDDFIPEEESDSDDEAVAPEPEPESDVQARSAFERMLKERFIYGLLDNIDYDKVDWDESLAEADDREAEERWFNEDD